MQTLLKLLGDGRFHSGEELGAALGISRSAVWKRLQGLESEFGLEVQSVRGRGYRLAEPLVAIDPQQVRAPWPLDVLFSVDSTNAEVMRRLDAGAATPFAVVAERQTAGRGRRGRAWVSPFGANLYCTLGISVRGGPKELEGLSLVVGLAVVRALGSLDIGQGAVIEAGLVLGIEAIEGTDALIERAGKLPAMPPEMKGEMLNGVIGPITFSLR